MDTKETGTTPAEKLEADIVGAKPVRRVETPTPPATGGPQHNKSAEVLAAKAADAPKPVAKTPKNSDLSWVKWFERGLLVLVIFAAALVGGWIAKSDDSEIARRVFARVQAIGQTPAATTASGQKVKTPAKAVTPALDKRNKPVADKPQPEETIQLAPGMTPVAEEN